MKKTELLTAGFAVGLVLALQSGYAVAQPPTTTEAGTLTQPAAKPEANQQKATEPAKTKQAESISGKVVETMNSSGYTYVGLEKDGKTTWVAIPATKITVGEEIEVWSGTQMGKFTSKTLNKTFEEITFSPGLVTNGKPKLPAEQKPMGEKPKTGHEQPAKAASPQQKDHGMNAQPAPGMTAISGKVVESLDSGGYTYVLLENEGKKAWAAMPATPVKVGQQLTLQPGMKMDKFTSKSLNRTFDSVIFSGGIIPAAEK